MGFLSVKEFLENPKRYMYDVLDTQLARKYWEGVLSLPKKRWGDLEVLSDAAIVVEKVVEKTKRLRPGDDVVIGEEGLNAILTLYFTKENDSRFTEAEIQRMVKDISKGLFTHDVKIDDKEYARKNGEAAIEFNGILRKGAKLQISYVISGTRKNVLTRDDEISPRYTNIGFNFYLGRRLYVAKDNQPYFRFEARDFLNPGIWDMSKFFK